MKYLKLIFSALVFVLIFSTCDRSPIIIEEEFPEHHYRNKFLGTWVDYYNVYNGYIKDTINLDNSGWYNYLWSFTYTEDGKLYYLHQFFKGDSLLSHDLSSEQFFRLDTIGICKYYITNDTTIFEYNQRQDGTPFINRYKYLFTSDTTLIIYDHIGDQVFGISHNNHLIKIM